MHAEKTEGVVIRQVDFSESSRVVTFFTREQGKITTLAKGAKRVKGPFQSALDLLATCRLVFLRKSSSSLDILTDAQLLARFQVRGRNLTGLYGGYYVAELLAGLTEDYDPHPTLYEAAITTLERLQQEVDPYPALLRFQLVLLREIGLLPEFGEEVVDGREIPGNRRQEAGGRRQESDQSSLAATRRGALPPDHQTPDDQTPDHQPTGFALWVSQGGLISSEHRPAQYRHRSEITPGSLRVLQQLAHEDESIARLATPTVPQIRGIQRLLTAALSAALGRRPKMLRYLTNP